MFIRAVEIVEGQSAVPRRLDSFHHLLSPLTGAVLVEIRCDVHPVRAVVGRAALLHLLLSARSVASSLTLVLRLRQVSLQMYPTVCCSLGPSS